MTLGVALVLVAFPAGAAGSVPANGFALAIGGRAGAAVVPAETNVAAELVERGAG